MNSFLGTRIPSFILYDTNQAAMQMTEKTAGLFSRCILNEAAGFFKTSIHGAQVIIFAPPFYGTF